MKSGNAAQASERACHSIDFSGTVQREVKIKGKQGHNTTAQKKKASEINICLPKVPDGVFKLLTSASGPA